MSTNRPTSPFSASLRLLLPIAAGLAVLGVALLGLFDQWDSNKPATQAARPAQASQATGEEKNPSSANTTATAAAHPPVSSVPPSASPAPTNTRDQQTPTTAAATPASTPRPQAGAQDNSLIDPQSTETALAPGEAAHLQVTVGGVQTPLLSPNQVGSFPRVYLPLGGQADVQVQLPEAQVGDQVVAAMEDGGTFGNGKPVQTFTVDDSHQVAFQFKLNEQRGTFRVSLHHNAQTKVVTFWAGDRTASYNY